MSKKLQVIVATIVGLFTIIGGVYGTVALFETRAHADEQRELIKQDVAAASKVLLRIQRQQVRKDISEIVDRQETTDPLGMDQPDRDRYRELLDELEWIDKEIAGGSS